MYAMPLRMQALPLEQHILRLVSWIPNIDFPFHHADHLHCEILIP